MAGENVVLIDHNPKWKQIYDGEVVALREALSASPLRLHHIGSTSVEGMVARPIVDILGVVDRTTQLATLEEPIVELGFRKLERESSKERLLFRKKNPDISAPHMMADFVQLLILPQRARETEELLIFRDYLRSHTAAVHDFNRLKLDLQGKHRGDAAAYEKGKKRFIRSLLAAATYDRAG